VRHVNACRVQIGQVKSFMLEWVTTARKQKALEVKALAVRSSGQDTIIQSPIPNSSPRLWRIAAVILKFRDLSLALLVRSEVRRETFDGRFSPERRSNELVSGRIIERYWV
jgi:hypothetical protein